MDNEKKKDLEYGVFVLEEKEPHERCIANMISRWRTVGQR